MIVLVLVMVVTGILFAWLLLELGRMAVGEFRSPLRLGPVRHLAPVAHVQAWVTRFVGSGGEKSPHGRPADPRPADPPREAAPGAEEIEERIYERLYGHRGRGR